MRTGESIILILTLAGGYIKNNMFMFRYSYVMIIKSLK